MTEEQILSNIMKICRKYQAKEVILFGSRAKGTATERSDFDVAVSGVAEFEDLKEEIEDIQTLYSFDIIDMDMCRNELLMEEIRSYGRKIL